MEFSKVKSVQALDEWRVRVTCYDGTAWERDLSDLVEADGSWSVLAESDHFSKVEITDRGIAVGWPSVKRYLDIPVWRIMEEGERVDE